MYIYIYAKTNNIIELSNNDISASGVRNLYLAAMISF